MGSVRDLYTTGDNDPEIEPVQYYRHYLYCDACGSFQLDPWTVPAELEKAERTRHRLAIAALIVSPLVVVSLGSVIGLVLSPAALVALAAALVIAPALHGLVSKESAARRWRFVRGSLLAIPMLWAADALLPEVLPPWPMLVGGAVLVAGLLAARALVNASRGDSGLRCRGCAATYPYGTPFFTDLDANPRHLAVADVPRPLGSSPFQRGASVP